MDTPKITASDIIARWPCVEVLADDVGVEPIAVTRWGQRNSINAKHDMALIAAARRRRIKLNAQELMRMRAGV